ncbi:MAG: hypothetical protein AAF696_15825 [Bacteroidota bacterium]
MRVRFISLFLLLFFCGQLTAQTGKKEDVISLKNGQIVYGWILEQVPGESVKIELVGGSVLVIEQEKIATIDRGPSRFRKVSRIYNYRLKPILFREKGAYAYFTPIFSLREGDDFNGFETSRLDVGIHLRLGYRLNRFIATGVGIGVDNYEGGVYMPIYLDVHGDLLRKRLTPHYQVSFGHGFGVNPNWPSAQIEGGTMGFAGMGYKIHTQGNLEWIILAGYKFQRSSERQNNFRGVPGGNELRAINRRGLTFQFSIGF